MGFSEKGQNSDVAHEAYKEEDVLNQFPRIRELKEHYPEIAQEFIKSIYLIENIPSGIFVANKDGSIKWTNNNAERIFGYKKEELIGINISKLKSGHQNDEFYEDVVASVLSDGYWHGEVRSLNKFDEQIHLWLHLFPLFDKDLKISEFVLVADEMNHEMNDRELTDIYIDKLTQLGTKEKLQNDITESIQRNPDMKHYLVLINLQKFSDVNIRFGYVSGDSLLRDIGLRILKSNTSGGLSYRISNDTFAILVTNVDGEGRYSEVSKQVDRIFNSPFFVRKKEINIAVKGGVSVYPNDGNNYDELLQNAESALQYAKRSESSRIQFSSTELNEEMLYWILLEEEMQAAIDNKSFNMEYQILVRNKTREIFGVEALVRWNHPTFGKMRPDKFIPLAESTGLMVPMGYLIIENVFKDAQRFYATNNRDHFFTINISAKQFEDHDFIPVVKELMEKYNIEENQIIFEFTERVASKNEAFLVKIFKILKSMGIKIALDDFGKGESSLSFLTEFEIDIVKIDASFIEGILEDEHKKKMLRAILNFCNEIDVVTIVEGVETEDQIQFLESVNCDILQGYYFSMPKCFEDLEFNI